VTDDIALIGCSVSLLTQELAVVAVHVSWVLCWQALSADIVQNDVRPAAAAAASTVSFTLAGTETETDKVKG